MDTHGEGDTADGDGDTPDTGPLGPTVVFDAGQNSAANFAHLAETGLHSVGSLPPSDFPDRSQRLRHPRTRVRGRPAGHPDPLKQPAHQTSQRLRPHPGQASGARSKTNRALGEPAATPARGKTRRLPNAVQAEVTRITRPRWISRVLSTELTGTTPATMRLIGQIDPAARKTLETEIFGKCLLVADHDDWTVAQVVAAYRSQNDD